MGHLIKSATMISSLALAASVPGIALAQAADVEERETTNLVVNLGEQSEIYDRWAGEDQTLTVDEWDRAVDLIFGEQAVNLAASRWDADSNGKISKEEFKQAVAGQDLFDAGWGAQALFQAQDEDQDQQLSETEFQNFASEDLNLYSEWDANDDNRIDQEEFAQMGVDAEFNQLDEDGDGYLAEEEAYNGLFSFFDDNEDAHWEIAELDDAGDAGIFDI